MVCHELRHYRDAELIASRALGLAEASGDTVSVAVARNNLAALRLLSPSPWLASEPLGRQVGEPCGTDGAALHNLGVLECLRGRYREAACLLSWAQVILEDELGPDAAVVQACKENLDRVRSLGRCEVVEAATA